MNKKLKLKITKVIYVIAAGGLLFNILIIPITVMSYLIDHVTGWGNNFDNWAQVSIQAQVLALILVAIITFIFLFLVRNLPPFKGINLDIVSRAIIRSKVGIFILILIFGVVCLSLLAYTGLYLM